MNAGDAYSGADRLLHRLAFRGIGLQKVLADVEDTLFPAQLDGLDVVKPVFVTSLPRAGTTLLLEILAASPELATHTYRDMPFVLCPLLWQRISGRSRKQSELRERAHGDGMRIGFDSPEAFEEIIWQAFWKRKYGTDHIDLWTAQDRDEEFETFFRNHMRKIIALRSSTGAAAVNRRYLSKNNANIARLGLLPDLFPDCHILVPVRHPLAHTASMHRQHVRFTEAHREDRFGRQYMAWLGHFEFGANLRPLDFGQWPSAGDRPDPADKRFWLEYWAAAGEHMLATAGPHVTFIDYDGLCADPAPGLTALADRLQIDSSALLAQTARFRPPTAWENDALPGDDALASRVSGIYDALLERTKS